jgi:hypothetical protein
VQESLDEQYENPENYRIFPAKKKTDGMKAQPYSNRFL